MLFSDGTGNSSAKLQKTNVWRLYEALDLASPTLGEPEQIAYYDNGVGTSSFKLLTILGGVFGLGLASNVREIYKFLCRTYRPGDRIYAFGFSRGAFTIRLLVGLVARKGLVAYVASGAEAERNLDRDARDIWRESRRRAHTNNCISDLLVCLLRALMRGLVSTKRLMFGQRGYAAGLRAIRAAQGQPPESENFLAEWWAFTKAKWFDSSRLPPDRDQLGPPIEFVGVWDTVAAYGGPIVELTRSIDEWVWPLMMTDFELSKKVRCARHALAIDDKRDSFHPLLWDEVLDAEAVKAHNATAAETEKLAEDRLQQVWFAGMHSDVGGGYADESLSFVSLTWMIEHAEARGLHMIPDLRQRIVAMQNYYAPMHDSRGGGSAFYRYQPRYINAWLANQEALHLKRTRIFRDQTISLGRYVNHGLLKEPIRLHASVEARLAYAGAGYGPNNLPRHYKVDDGIRGLGNAQTLRDAPNDWLGRLGSGIKLRRMWYFLTMVGVSLIAAKPWWDSLRGFSALNDGFDASAAAGPVWRVLGLVLPDFSRKWVEALLTDPLSATIIILLLLVTVTLGRGHEKTMGDQSRALWAYRFAPDAPALPVERLWIVSRLAHCAASGWQNCSWLQSALAAIKWKWIPRASFPLLLLWWWCRC